jgi:hypothetical protein
MMYAKLAIPGFLGMVFILFGGAFTAHAAWTTSGTDTYTTDNVGIGTTAPSYAIEAHGSANADAFYFEGKNGTTGERDVFTIKDHDWSGSAQDESSVLKVDRSRAWSDGVDGSSLVELTYSSTLPTVDDRHFYMLGRAGASADEGEVSWGISLTESNFWTSGSIMGGATGTDCGGTGAACFSDPAFVLSADSDSYITGGNFGIGTSTPDAPLHVDGDDGVLFEGAYGSGSLSTTGAGTRMLWYPGKAAFRAGYVGGTQWDDSSIGDYSASLGVGSEASGQGAMSFGSYNVASGQYSTAIGYNNDATSQSDVAIGQSADASGGISVAIGAGPEASGVYSVAIGSSVTSSGNSSAAFGSNSEASGDIATAMGSSTEASGDYSSAFNSYTTSSGNASTSMGYRTTAQAYGSLVIGRYNEIDGTTTSWTGSDPVFVIGNGSSSSSTANAFSVNQDGTIKVTGDITSDTEICIGSGC